MLADTLADPDGEPDPDALGDTVPVAIRIAFQTVTPSESQSASATASRSQTPSLSQSPSQSPTLTASQSQTPSQTPSVTATQTSTGFPVDTLIDNTFGGSVLLLANESRLVSQDIWYAVSFYLPESDPVCGIGSYDLKSLTLPLVLAEPVPGGMVLLTLLLYRATSAGVPESDQTFIGSAAFRAVGIVSSTPAYFEVTLPSNWLADATLSRYFSIVFRTQTYAVSWVSPDDGNVDHLPVSGFGVPWGVYTSVDQGTTWTSDTPTYGGIFVTAEKNVCSPTSTPSHSLTPSQSGSQTFSPSVNPTPTQTQTETQQITPTFSQTSTETMTASLTGTRSRTMTQTPKRYGIRDTNA